MTLSRGPYSELDKMSLFQDLKLKRRKIDSRCSSDGESIADTSTSSPDLLQSLSPKMCDPQHQQTVASHGLVQDIATIAETAENCLPPKTQSICEQIFHRELFDVDYSDPVNVKGLDQAKPACADKQASIKPYRT
ncbi:uncharacterized protein LOC126576596 [Anopheles aquasalis]|uniref:uncharacterized protein LOC126576596 n=1 Tax=Anopheles aquasalis TaxID=42839 RepID=UPI00215A3CC8|nr:uncharacterized protein LOC126576596 [Anopheles aquasalis]